MILVEFNRFFSSTCVCTVNYWLPNFYWICLKNHWDLPISIPCVHLVDLPLSSIFQPVAPSRKATKPLFQSFVCPTEFLFPVVFLHTGTVPPVVCPVVHALPLCQSHCINLTPIPLSVFHLLLCYYTRVLTGCVCQSQSFPWECLPSAGHFGLVLVQVAFLTFERKFLTFRPKFLKLRKRFPNFLIQFLTFWLSDFLNTISDFLSRISEFESPDWNFVLVQNFKFSNFFKVAKSLWRLG